MIEPPCTERYARWCERSAAQLMGSLLLDLFKCRPFGAELLVGEVYITAHLMNVFSCIGQYIL